MEGIEFMDSYTWNKYRSGTTVVERHVFVLHAEHWFMAGVGDVCRLEYRSGEW